MWLGVVDITTEGFIWVLFLNDKPTLHLTKPSSAPAESTRGSAASIQSSPKFDLYFGSRAIFYAAWSVLY
jgi:hypothetical protein